MSELGQTPPLPTTYHRRLPTPPQPPTSLPTPPPSPPLLLCRNWGAQPLQAGIYFARALDLDKATADNLQRQPREAVENHLNSVMTMSQKGAEIDQKFAAHEFQTVLNLAEGI